MVLLRYSYTLRTCTCLCFASEQVMLFLLTCVDETGPEWPFSLLSSSCLSAFRMLSLIVHGENVYFIAQTSGHLSF